MAVLLRFLLFISLIGCLNLCLASTSDILQAIKDLQDDLEFLKEAQDQYTSDIARRDPQFFRPGFGRPGFGRPPFGPGGFGRPQRPPPPPPTPSVDLEKLSELIDSLGESLQILIDFVKNNLPLPPPVTTSLILSSATSTSQINFQSTTSSTLGASASTTSSAFTLTYSTTTGSLSPADSSTATKYGTMSSDHSTTAYPTTSSAAITSTYVASTASSQLSSSTEFTTYTPSITTSISSDSLSMTTTDSSFADTTTSTSSVHLTTTLDSTTTDSANTAESTSTSSNTTSTTVEASTTADASSSTSYTHTTSTSSSDSSTSAIAESSTSIDDMGTIKVTSTTLSSTSESSITGSTTSETSTIDSSAVHSTTTDSAASESTSTPTLTKTAINTTGATTTTTDSTTSETSKSETTSRDSTTSDYITTSSITTESTTSDATMTESITSTSADSTTTGSTSEAESSTTTESTSGSTTTSDYTTTGDYTTSRDSNTITTSTSDFTTSAESTKSSATSESTIPVDSETSTTTSDVTTTTILTTTTEDASITETTTSSTMITTSSAPTPTTTYEFDPGARSLNLVYYGQTTSPVSLPEVCADDKVDIITIGFITGFFVQNDLNITMNQGSHCWAPNAAQQAAGATGLKDCVEDGVTGYAAQIKQCQERGKKVLISAGGVFSNLGIPSEEAAERLADRLWNLFLGGTDTDIAPTRPYGDVVLDGFDFDNENPANKQWLPKVASSLRQLMASDSSKKYYLTATPQCPYSDASIPVAEMLESIDFFSVQFYQNPSCQLNSGQGFQDSVQAWSDILSGVTAATHKNKNKNKKMKLAKKTRYHAGRLHPERARKPNSPLQQLKPVTKNQSHAKAHTKANKRQSSNEFFDIDNGITSPRLLIGTPAFDWATADNPNPGYVDVATYRDILELVNAKNLTSLAGAMFWDGGYQSMSAQEVDGQMLTYADVVRAVFGTAPAAAAR